MLNFPKSRIFRVGLRLQSKPLWGPKIGETPVNSTLKKKLGLVTRPMIFYGDFLHKELRPSKTKKKRLRNWKWFWSRWSSNTVTDPKSGTTLHLRAHSLTKIWRSECPKWISILRAGSNLTNWGRLSWLVNHCLSNMSHLVLFKRRIVSRVLGSAAHCVISMESKHWWGNSERKEPSQEPGEVWLAVSKLPTSLSIW